MLVIKSFHTFYGSLEALHDISQILMKIETGDIVKFGIIFSGIK